LAEKTIEDVLLHFGETLKVARRTYRQYACAVKSISEYFRAGALAVIHLFCSQKTKKTVPPAMRDIGGGQIGKLALK